MWKAYDNYFIHNLICITTINGIEYGVGWGGVGWGGVGWGGVGWGGVGWGGVGWGGVGVLQKPAQTTRRIHTNIQIEKRILKKIVNKIKIKRNGNRKAVKFPFTKI